MYMYIKQIAVDSTNCWHYSWDKSTCKQLEGKDLLPNPKVYYLLCNVTNLQSKYCKYMYMVQHIYMYMYLYKYTPASVTKPPAAVIQASLNKN